MPSKKSAIDTKLIKELAELLNDADLSEVEVNEGELHIRLSREIAPVAAPVVAQVAAPAAVAPAASSAPAVASPSATAPAAAEGTPVTSPMVGTAYLSPAPGADPFVKVGDKIKAGQTILIVEAMKTMNQIPCTEDGIISAINVEDGQPVEFGETLITLK